MKLILEVNNSQLKAFVELARKMNVKHSTLNEAEAKEDEALYHAMSEGDQELLSEAEKEDFMNWLKK